MGCESLHSARLIMKPQHKPPIYELKITLEDVRPLVWRRFLADPLCTLPLLHLILQAVMGWKNRHLHCFESRGDQYATLSPDLPGGCKDERRYRLGSLVKTAGESFSYLYDFGDGWRHTVTLERNHQRSRSLVHPKCVAGENACPPEDTGGSPGYRRLQLILSNPSLKEHGRIRDWVGKTFDPHKFKLAHQNLPMWKP